MFFINYHTGVDDEVVEGTLSDAMAVADKAAAYTQQGISISDDDGNVVAERRWWGVQFDEDESEDENPICFGEYGYYSDWQFD